MSSREVTKGYLFFSQGYVHETVIYKNNDSDVVEIKAKCYRSMRKSQPPHKINLIISPTQQDNVIFFFSTTTRLSVTCCHTIGVVYTVSHFQQLGLKEVPAFLSATSLPQQWHKPRGKIISPRPVSSMVFAKTKDKPRKR
ncbi:uncharacterized protein LOC117305734 [Asterias rubens]|uniref:uncharacterized protein LOC117305734 n=1 Tax=Asterias rubens TaxID=7604 RepID=UPI0014550754|nr:uncharacterized protein LOC117305734 [Asterias rubens]